MTESLVYRHEIVGRVRWEKTRHCILPWGIAFGPEKVRIDRKILDLCRHVQELDVRDEYGHDLEEFKKSIEKKPSGPDAGGATAKHKPNK